MRYVLAVSGGIDSMVMLDLMVKVLRKEIQKQREEYEKFDGMLARVVVASFDHGIRPSSEDDVGFVHRVSDQINPLMFYSAKSNLGEGASEESARKVRYSYLRDLAARLDLAKPIITRNPDCDGSEIPDEPRTGVEICTAHHLDDLVETVIINLLRGTGWRGLACLDTPGIRRPFLEPEMLTHKDKDGSVKVFAAPLDKRAIVEYAAKNCIAFREDPTNSSDEYLRNRIRHQMNNCNEKMVLFDLWQEQKVLKRRIDDLVQGLIPGEGKPWEREWFRELDADELGRKVAIELLRAGTLRVGIRATRPQLERFRQAILSYTPGKCFNLPENHLVKFTRAQFWL